MNCDCCFRPRQVLRKRHSSKSQRRPSRRQRRRKTSSLVARSKLLVCDLDNTLYDWVSYFVPSFYAMVDAVVAITGCEREKLLDDFRAVHQAHSDAEHPFALLETETIKRRYSSAKAVKELDPAFHAFNSERKRHL